jgi:hypothetical protein
VNDIMVVLQNNSTLRIPAGQRVVQRDDGWLVGYGFDGRVILVCPPGGWLSVYEAPPAGSGGKQ